jgi:hypothetical protein
VRLTASIKSMPGPGWMKISPRVAEVEMVVTEEGRAAVKRGVDERTLKKVLIDVPQAKFKRAWQSPWRGW